MSVTVNGKPRDLRSGFTIPQMLDALGIKPEQVAVAVNGEVITRRLWGETTVKEGDAVEIVRAVGGG
jgi:sulfur carrier protein